MYGWFQLYGVVEYLIFAGNPEGIQEPDGTRDEKDFFWDYVHFFKFRRSATKTRNHCFYRKIGILLWEHTLKNDIGQNKYLIFVLHYGNMPVNLFLIWEQWVASFFGFLPSRRKFGVDLSIILCSSNIWLKGGKAGEQNRKMCVPGGSPGKSFTFPGGGISK